MDNLPVLLACWNTVWKSCDPSESQFSVARHNLHTKKLLLWWHQSIAMINATWGKIIYSFMQRCPKLDVALDIFKKHIGTLNLFKKCGRWIATEIIWTWMWRCRKLVWIYFFTSIFRTLPIQASGASNSSHQLTGQEQLSILGSKSLSMHYVLPSKRSACHTCKHLQIECTLRTWC